MTSGQNSPILDRSIDWGAHRGVSEPIVRAAWLLCVAAVLVVYMLLYRRELLSGLEYDEAFNLEVVKNLAEGRGYASLGTHHAGVPVPFDALISTGPTFILPGAVIWHLTNGALWAVRLVPLAYFTLLLWSLWMIGKQFYYSRWVGLALVCTPLLLDVSLSDENGIFVPDLTTATLVPGRFIGEFAAVALIVTAVVALAKDHAFIGGLMAGLAVQTKANFVLPGALLLVAWFLYHWLGSRRLPLRVGSVVAAGAVLPTLAFETYRFASLGSISSYRESVGGLAGYVGSQAHVFSFATSRVAGFVNLLDVGGMVILMLVAIILTINGLLAPTRMDVPPTPIGGRAAVLLTSLAAGASALLIIWVAFSGQPSVRQGIPSWLMVLPVLVCSAVGSMRVLSVPSRFRGIRFVVWVLPIFVLCTAVWHQAVLLVKDNSRSELLADQLTAVEVITESRTPALPAPGWLDFPEFRVLSDTPSEAMTGADRSTVEVFTSLNGLFVYGVADARLMEPSCVGDVLFSSRNVIVCCR